MGRKKKPAEAIAKAGGNHFSFFLTRRFTGGVRLLL